MKKLILMRHGKSSWKDNSLADVDRPLKKRGQRNVASMAQVLLDEELIPDLILSSPAERASQTAEIMVKNLGIKKDSLLYVDSIYMADVEDFYELLAGVDDQYDVVMLIGHNPSLEALMQSLTGDIDALPTAGVAYIRLDINQWGEISAEETSGNLKGLWRPKELDA